MLHRHAVGAEDRRRLVERTQVRRDLARVVEGAHVDVTARVRRVDAAPFFQRHGHADQFVLVGEHPGCIPEPGRQPDGALVEGGPRHVGHAGDLLRGGRGRVDALHGGAQRAVSDQLGQIQRQARPLEPLEKLAHAAPGIVEVVVVQHAPDERQQDAVAGDERGRGAAAVAADDRRDALLEQRREHGAVIVVRQHPIAVRVHVDEPRRDDLAATVEGGACRRTGQCAHGGDAPVRHGH